MKLLIDTHLGRAINYRPWLAKRVRRYGGIHGMTVGQLAGRAKAPVKFIDPNDATRRWSGRGSAPAWYKAYVALHGDEGLRV